MLKVEVDEAIVERLMREEIEKRVEAASKQLVYWDSKELKRRTCLSWNTIQEHFFHDPDFPKVKVGAKWLFPAKETEEFLLRWINRQRNTR